MMSPMPILTRKDLFQKLFPKEPAFRWKQAEKAMFEPGKTGWNDCLTLPKEMRETMAKEIPWISCTLKTMRTSKEKDTFKALLRTEDALNFETVLMKNTKNQWTLCVSSQIGCAMGCVFCATGAMGLKRSLVSDEIVDQYRFWRSFLRENFEDPRRISNIVFMGMGEPMANYENVKSAITSILENTDIGPTCIAVSTVGILWQMQKLLTDPTWPSVCIAVSLHSANQKKRKEIVPSTTPNFIQELLAWSKAYAGTLGNRRHHITFEYTLIAGENDTDELARELGAFAREAGECKINVIPLNRVRGKSFTPSETERREKFKRIVASFGVDVTERRSMGNDIAAACGQLALEA